MPYPSLVSVLESFVPGVVAVPVGEHVSNKMKVRMKILISRDTSVAGNSLRAVSHMVILMGLDKALIRSRESQLFCSSG